MKIHESSFEDCWAHFRSRALVDQRHDAKIPSPRGRSSFQIVGIDIEETHPNAVAVRSTSSRAINQVSHYVSHKDFRRIWGIANGELAIVSFFHGYTFTFALSARYFQDADLSTGWLKARYDLIVASRGGGGNGYFLPQPSEDVDDESEPDGRDSEHSASNATGMNNDQRKHVQGQQVIRSGQAQFRGRLLEAYRGRCAISGVQVECVLEAAHIMPYRGQHTDVTTNGILLRADLHSLFDEHLLRIDPDSLTVELDDSLRGSEYFRKFHGKPLKVKPTNPAHWPNPEFLRMRANEPSEDV